MVLRALKTHQTLRDYLLPGAWHIGEGKWDLDVSDGDNVQLITDCKKMVILTREEIEGGAYKALFAPRLQQVKETGEWH